MRTPTKKCKVCSQTFSNLRLNKLGQRIRKFTKSKWRKAKFCSSKCYWEDMKGKPGVRKGTGKSENYSAIHKWVVVEKGFARDNRCSFCGKQAKEWANIDWQYRRRLNDYIPLCLICHRRYDKR